MDRGWYVRLLVVVSAAVLCWLTIWPSLDDWGMGKYLPAPAFVKEHFKGRISPGLDIQGGLRLMYEVEVDEAVRDRRDRIVQSLRGRLGETLGIIEEGKATVASREELEKVDARVKVKAVDDRDIRVEFAKAADAEKLTNEFLKRNFPELKRLSRNDGVVALTMDPAGLEKLRQTAVEQAVKTVSSRINELEVRDMNVQGRDDDLIIEIPGASQEMFDRVRSIVSKTAKLEFKVLDDESTFLADLSDLPEGITKRQESSSAGESRPNVVVTYLHAKGAGSRQKLLNYIATLTPPDGRQVVIGPSDIREKEDGQGEEAWRTYFLFSTTDVTGEDVDNAMVGYDEQRKPDVQIEFTSRGADAFGRMTGQNVKRRMAIVLDSVVESAPVIQTRIGGGHCRITLGSFGDYNTLMREANDLVVVLRAGALPAPIRPANEQLIGPSLGRDAVKQGGIGAVVGIVIVLLFMLVYYEVAGLVADLMVILNVLVLLAILAFLEATLTLPGIAGIALTVGMAVDANVLMTERMREEFRLGKSPRAVVEQGYHRAFTSIFDSHVTTFIAGVVLFQYGTGPIKGFAVTLIIGIVSSLFTGVFCSKVMLDWIVRGLKVNRLRVG